MLGVLTVGSGLILQTSCDSSKECWKAVTEE